MSATLRLMKQKMETLRYGLLRIRDGKDHQSVQISNSVYDGQRLNCIINDSETDNELLNREVILIQKNGDDYFYITGRIEKEVKRISRVVSMSITKACWFTRKKKGAVVWLQQQYAYESVPPTKAG